MRIALLGVQCDNANLGVAALAYSIASMVHRLAPGPIEFMIFSDNSEAELARAEQTLGLADRTLRAVPIRHRNPRSLLNAVRTLRSCVAAIDLTGGDSFADIYGLKRLGLTLFDKELVLLSRTPLVIAPQTLGPFRNPLGRMLSMRTLARASQVFARDQLSLASLKGLKKEVQVATDIAVTLPWDKTSLPPAPDGRAHVGLNVSGLLWHGGYTGTNQFGLRADYREYTLRLLESLVSAGHQVHLVPHVIARPGQPAIEDDVAVCEGLLNQFPQCTLAPSFQNPVEAKSYIAALGCFIGARMHSTIAALTAGVATIPVAYSRKFAGFYGNLGYDFVVDLLQIPTAEAVTATLGWVADRKNLSLSAVAATRRAQTQIEVFETWLAEYLKPNHGRAAG